MLIQRIHILGASGSGTTTLGRALAAHFQCLHCDTDDYFWLPTDPPFTQQRERAARQQLLMNALSAQDSWVLSGSLCGRGDVAIPLFGLVVFLWLPTDRRIERLRHREGAMNAPSLWQELVADKTHEDTLHFLNAHIHMLNDTPVEHSCGDISPTPFLLEVRKTL